MIVAQVSFSSGAGRGYDLSELSFVEKGKITRLSLNNIPMIGLIATVVGSADDLLVSGVVETPVFGADHRVYLLVDNTKLPERVNRMTALLTIRNG